jgi:hypothetical protein
MAGVVAIGEALILPLMWLFVTEPVARKFAATFEILMIGVLATLGTALAASSAKAYVRDGTLRFRFCGIETRSILLGPATTFELRTLGRLRMLIIHNERGSYVPNGALDIDEIANLLRANGIIERAK